VAWVAENRLLPEGLVFEAVPNPPVTDPNPPNPPNPPVVDCFAFEDPEKRLPPESLVLEADPNPPVVGCFSFEDVGNRLPSESLVFTGAPKSPLVVGCFMVEDAESGPLVLENMLGCLPGEVLDIGSSNTL
jgi:hypothetical protein